MGHTIGYIREKSSNPTFGVSSSRASEGKPEKHEYHSIGDNEDDDDEFFKPLDLGPSLLDEVFSELGSPNNKSKLDVIEVSADPNKKSSDTKKDLKELVSSTLNIRRHK